MTDQEIEELLDSLKWYGASGEEREASVQIVQQTLLVERLEGRVEALEEERERWQTASMLETSAGDPADLTPEPWRWWRMLERFMSRQERDHARALLEAKIEALVTMAGHDCVGWQDREHLPDLCPTCVATAKLRHELAALRAEEST